MATRNQINPPPLRKITDFKSKLTGGGARPNLFEVVLSFPTAAPADNVTLDKARFLVKTAALPASNVSPIDVPFRGRIFKERIIIGFNVIAPKIIEFSLK